MITKKRIGSLILIILLVVVLFYIGTTDAVNKDSETVNEEGVTTEEVVTDDGYDVEYDENGNMTPESMQNIVNQEMHKEAYPELTEEEKMEIYSEIMEQEAADEYEPPTGAKPW